MAPGQRWEGVGTKHIDADSITLELLQSYYNIPLAELAKELGLSLTLLKKICRKFGIQRWPHRQIRSLNKNAQELRERAAVATSPDEQADIQLQLELLEKKKRLVTRGASSGLQSALRNALFLANPDQLHEDDMFDVKVPLAQQHAKLQAHLASPSPPPAAIAAPVAQPAVGGVSNPMYKMMQHMSRAAERDMLVSSDLLPSEQKQQQQQHSWAPAPVVAPAPVSQFSGYMQTPHQQQQSELLLQQQMAAHMSQMALHQQLQMNNYMCVAPAQPQTQQAAQPMYDASFDSAFDNTPFDEVAALLGMDADLPNGVPMPEDFDADFMDMMMETCASGELDGPVGVHAPPQQLPAFMQTGHALHQQPAHNGGAAAFGAYQAPSPYMHMGWNV